jgi:predicted MarR family transcription regulator
VETSVVKVSSTARENRNPESTSEDLSQLEMSLTVLWNSAKRWLSKRSSVNGLSDLDVFLMHLLAYRNTALRASDLAFALAIDDMHLVSYSLKKLTKMGLTTSAKSGKEVMYRATRAAIEHRNAFLDDRARYVEPAIADLIASGMDIKALTTALRALSGVYEQAARAAAYEKGDGA